MIDINEFSNGSINTSNPNMPYWSGTGVFDEIIAAVNGNIKIQFDTGRITGAEYAQAYVASLQSAMSEAMKFVLNKQSIEKDLEVKDIQIALSETQLAESAEKWAIQKQVLENQLAMSNVDANYKEANALREMEIRDKQIESAAADIAFNESKKLIMEQTRKDNIRSKSAEQFAEFMKYLSAANVVPGAADFATMRDAVYAISAGIADSDVVGTVVSVATHTRTGAGTTASPYVYTLIPGKTPYVIAGKEVKLSAEDLNIVTPPKAV